MSVLSQRGVRKLVALAAGVAAVGAALAQPPSPPTPDKAPPPAPTTTLDPVRAADPLGAMLADAKAAHGKLRDYVCTFTRQERVNGTIGPEQVAEMKVRVQPFAVHVRFARPEAIAGLELSYGVRRDGKVRVRPAGADGVKGFVTVAAEDPRATGGGRHPATELGIGKVIDRLAASAAREKAIGNPVEVYASDYQFAGRVVTRYEVFNRRPHAHRYAYLCVVYVDKETKLPVRFEAYDTPKPGTTAGDLLEAYSYTDVRVNVGLGDSAFDY
jgi:hypothetical protein